MFQQEAAHSIALQAAAWMAAESDMLGHFLGATGMSVQDLKERLADPEVLAAMIDFILMDDSTIIDCAAYCQIQPQDLATVRQCLPGGDVPNWT